MKRKFDAYDYVIFVVILLISIFIGLFFGFKLDEKFKAFIKKRRKNIGVKEDIEFNNRKKSDELDVDENEEETSTQPGSQTMNYFTANSSMGAFPIALSLLATFFSSSSLLGFPAEVYENGIQYFIIVLGVCFVPLIGAFLTGPFFDSLKVVSIFEYLKMRYNSELARLLGVSLYLIRTFIAMGIVIYGPATALSSLTDLSTEISILIIGVIATFYTTIGGIKAVIWTDAFQTIIMFSGMIAVIIKGIYDVGGFSNLIEINREGGRLNLFDFNPNPLIRQSFWPLTIGSFFAWSMSYALDQQMIQRFSAAKSKRTAQLALVLNIPGIILLIGICCFTGLVLYANYAKCDPVLNKADTNLQNYNQLLPYFVLDKFNNIPLVPGLFLSSIFCASLSSVSSALNSISACIWRDFFYRIFTTFTDEQSSRFNKLIVLICGAVCTGLSFLIAQIGSNLIQISNTINGALQAPIIGIFILSCLVPFANIYGLFAGALSGFAINSWIGLGSFIYKPTYPKLNVSIENCSSSSFTSTTTMTMTTMMTSMFQSRDGEATNLSGFNRMYSISYLWLSPIGVLTTVLVGVSVSLISNQIILNSIRKTNPTARLPPVNDSLILYRWLKLKRVVKL